jgi:hypothetical protein
VVLIFHLLCQVSKPATQVTSPGPYKKLSILITIIDGNNPQTQEYNTYPLAKGYSRIIAKDGLLDVRYTQPMPNQFVPVAAGGPPDDAQPQQQPQAQAQTQTQNYHQKPILVSIRNPYEGLSKDEAAKLTAWQAQNPHWRVVGNPKDLNGKIEKLVN